MKKLLGNLLYGTGVALSLGAALLAAVVLFGTVLWMHAPLGSALLVSFVLALPVLALAWLFRRTGRSMHDGQRRRPWFRVHADGRIRKQ